MNLFFNVLWRTLGHGGLRKAPKLEIRPYFLIPGSRENQRARPHAHTGAKEGKDAQRKGKEGQMEGKRWGRGRDMKGKGETNEGK